MNKFILVFVLVLALPLHGSGQKIVPSPSDLYAEALEYIFAGEYNEALPVLISLEEKGFGSANLSYKIGECYLNLPGQKTNAIAYLKDAAEKISIHYSGNTLEEEYAPVKSLLYLGIAYRLNNDLEKAQACFNAYLHGVDDVEVENKALAEYHLERCNNAKELMASPAVFVADTLAETINTVASNHNALATPDEQVIFYMNQLKFYDAVMHAIKSDTLWQNSENITPDIKSDGDHYLTGMTTDATRLFLTFYDPYLSGEIFTTRFENGKWSGVERLNENINTLFNESHASPSPDGKYLYFTSDRKGGYGGLDIYRSSLNASGDWDPPVNLGPLINSPYNEESPFLTPDSKKLFFSSQGHYNMGGYDVFMTEQDNNGNWLSPVNIGYPLNTTDDDLFFFPLASGKIAYQSVFVPGTGQQDILRYNIRSFGNPARFTVHGSIHVTGNPEYNPGNISLAIIDKNDSDTLVQSKLQDDGSFRHKIPGGDYWFDFSDKTGSLLVKELSIPIYFPHGQLVMNADIMVSPGIRTDTIYIHDIRFAFDKSHFDTLYRGYLDMIMEVLARHPEMKLQLNGYADSKGKESYNLKLSAERAHVVESYLKGNHIDPARISVDAFGEKLPVAKNNNDDGTDNPRGRSYNRRVELLFNNIPADLTVIRQNDIPDDLLSK